ncbi:MAG TPA: hypothetical protein VGR57_21880 [Ktedonobacterales bacterium]|nr:hypothetical protein [Ktedonobacterales bacterium]
MRTVSRAKFLTGLACLLSAIAISMALVVAAHAEPGLQSDLTAVSGQGSGHVDVSPTADDQHDTIFTAQGTAEVHDALADTTYVVQRAVDFTPGDGVCTIAPSPPAGWISLTTFTTSPAGAGAGHFERMTRPVGPQGFQFDIVFRVVKLNDNGTLDLSQVLMSACMTATVK